MSEGQVRIATTTESAEDLLKSAGPGAELTENSEPAGSTEQQRSEQQDAQQERDGRPRSSYQKRIDILTRRNKDYERQIAELKTKYERPGAMEERVFAQINQRRQAAQPANGNGSQLEARQAERREVPTETEAQRAERQLQEARDQMGQRLAANPEKKVALRAVVEEAVRNGRDVPPPAFLALIHQPNGEDILRHILENEEVLEKLSKMSEQRQYEAIHRISLDLDLNPPERESQPADRAPARTPPAPIRPVGGSSTRSSVPDEELSYREWASRRNSPAAVKERQRRGYGI